MYVEILIDFDILYVEILIDFCILYVFKYLLILIFCMLKYLFIFVYRMFSNTADLGILYVEILLAPPASGRSARVIASAVRCHQSVAESSVRA